jgi:hypothetical protein
MGEFIHPSVQIPVSKIPCSLPTSMFILHHTFTHPKRLHHLNLPLLFRNSCPKTIQPHILFYCCFRNKLRDSLRGRAENTSMGSFRILDMRCHSRKSCINSCAAAIVHFSKSLHTVSMNHGLYHFLFWKQKEGVIMKKAKQRGRREVCISISFAPSLIAHVTLRSPHTHTHLHAFRTTPHPHRTQSQR